MRKAQQCRVVGTAMVRHIKVKTSRNELCGTCGDARHRRECVAAAPSRMAARGSTDPLPALRRAAL